MKDKEKPKQQLINELAELRRRIAELEKPEKGRRQADEALQVSETRYRRLFETARDGILLLDADTGKITDVNPFLIDMLGYSHEELLGKNLWDIGLFKDIAASKAAFLDLQTKGYVRYEDLPFETKDGRSIDVEFVSNVYLVNHNKIIQCNIRDITERRRAEKVSQEARRYAENIIETVREPLVVLDKDLKVLSANRSFYSTFEVTPGETVGNLIYDIGNRQWNIPPLRKLLDDILQKNTQFNNYEVSHKFQTIGQKTMLLNARQIYQKVTGTPIILLAIEDITEKRRMEDELSKYREHIEQQIEERTAELKMTNEQLQLDITERKRAEEKAKRCAVEFKRAYEEMKRLNRDLSTLYTIDFAAAQSLDMEIMLNKVLETMLKALEIEAGSIYLREPNGDMTLYVYHGFSGEFVNNMQRINGEGVFGAAYTEKKPVVLDASEYPANRFASFIIQEDFHTLVIVPLISGGELIGILCMASHNAHAFPLGETELLSAIGQQMGTTMRNAWLYERVQRELDERNQAEKALRESEEKYRALMDNASDTIILMDMKGNLLEINRKTESLIGYTNEEVFNEHFSRFIPKKERERTIAAFKELVRKGSGILSDVPLLKKDGTTVPVDITGSIIQYGGKKVAQSILRDITERKKTDDALRESEEKFRSITTGAMDAIVSMDEHGRIYYFNPAGERIFGYTAEETIGKELHSLLVPGKYNDAYKKGFESFKATGKGRLIGNITEISALRKDGTEFPVEISISALQIQGKWHAVGIIRDITERKKAEEALKENEERYRRLVEFSPYGIAIHSEGKLVYMNLAGAKILGTENPEDFIGKTVFQIIHPDYHDIVRKRIRIQGQGKVAPPLEEKFLRLDGTSVDVEIASIPFTYMGKLAMYGVFRDITERKKAEEVHFENLRLEAADKAKSDFLANMSHELRTPLNASIGFSEILIQGMAGELSKKQKHFVDNILTSNQFLLTLINDILDLSKIEAGKIELVIEKISVPVTIKETLFFIKEKAMKKNVLLKTEIDPALECVEADKQRFKQILFNLLSNAVKFSKEEGGVVTITAKKEGDMAKVSVSDTGIGIKDEKIGRLFHKFEQLEKGISEKYGGTGLGLAITKHLVDLHGGKIRAESRYGVGSTFTFMLPLKAKNEENK